MVMVRFADVLEGHSGRRRFRPCLDEITRSQLVLSGLWRRGFCDACRVVGASAHIAGRTVSRHHGEGVVRENLRRENRKLEVCLYIRMRIDGTQVQCTLYMPQVQS
jgi:hypothetical protein